MLTTHSYQQLKPEEMKVIASIVSGDGSAKDKAYADGLYIAGDRYVMTKAEDRSIYARSVRDIPSRCCIWLLDEDEG